MVFTPILDELIVALTLSFILAMGYRFLTNPQEVKQIKEDIKSYRGKIKEAQKEGKAEEVNKLLSEQMKMTQKQMKSNMKPMFFSFIVFAVAVYGVMRPMYGELILQLPFTLPLLSYSWPFIILRDSIGWFWWYILITLPGTFIFRKLLGVE